MNSVISKEPLRRIRLTVAYDGGNYSGWQYQKNGTSVQAMLEEALRRFYPNMTRLQGSSRTDAGVHALGMEAHFDSPRGECRIPIRRLKLALNTYLPADIRVAASRYCSLEFHSRFSALGKEYRYSIWNHAAMNPLRRHQAWHVPVKLNLASMREAAARLLGRRDFKSFAGQHAYEAGCTVRTLKACRIRKRESLITVSLEADGFLYRMCRNIVGTLAQVGQGKMRPEMMPAILEGRHRGLAGMTAPPQGLILWKVFYPRTVGSRRPSDKGDAG